VLQLMFLPATLATPQIRLSVVMAIPRGFAGDGVVDFLPHPSLTGRDRRIAVVAMFQFLDRQSALLSKARLPALRGGAWGWREYLAMDGDSSLPGQTLPE
jgi:hypothetical protein